mmetsp:Transcript_40810/g.89576  ORF Transcript_40810/g.89576 Transcript_40810/m.89576 type:complete len:280 (-) Transcript_40810:540-1379(-)
MSAPRSLRNGVRNIVSTTTVSSSFTCGAGSMPWFCARPKSTNANSPPCERSKPVRSAAENFKLLIMHTRSTSAVLEMCSPSARPRTTGALARASGTSIEKPVVIKKRPSSSPLNGAMSASIWNRYLVSASSTPAKKAPSVSDRPSACVKADIEITVSSVIARKAVWSFAEATILKTGCSRKRPATPMRESAVTDLTAARRSAAPSCADGPPSSGVTTSNGTTARSWKSSMPKEARPNRVASSPFSERSWMTKADEERAKAPPRTTAAAALRPTSRANDE